MGHSNRGIKRKFSIYNRQLFSMVVTDQEVETTTTTSHMSLRTGASVCHENTISGHLLVQAYSYTAASTALRFPFFHDAISL